ncbi:MAG: beta strand repeat-containing protein [Janthinobacterium lividum]
MRATLLPFFYRSGRALLSSLCLLLLPLLGWAQSTTMVISQVYGGGGNSNATYQNDFVELHNISSSSVVMTNWTLQYTGQTGSFSIGTTSSISLTATVPAGGYYLIMLNSSNAAVGAPLPTPDATNTGINMAAGDGKVALANDGTAVSGPGASNVVDFVGYGSANVYEGTAAAPSPPSNVRAIFRGPSGTGCSDTNQNGADFTMATPAPRNASVTMACGPMLTTTPATLTGFTYVQGNGPSASQSFNVSGNNLTAGNLAITGSTDYEVSADNTTFGPTATIANATGGTLAPTPVYVRLKAGLATSSSSYNGETVAVNGGGATTKNVTVSGTVTGPVVPTLTTAAASAYTNTGATLGGNVTNTGGASVSSYGVVYSTTNATPTLADTPVAMSGGTTNFSQAVVLAAGSYYYRAYATNSAGTGYGPVRTLTVNPSPVIGSFNPATVNAGNGPTSITVYSSNNSFGVAGSATTATVNGNPRTVSAASPGQLTLDLLAGDVATAGTLVIVVTTPTSSYPGGGTSPAASYSVVNATPTISSLSPNSAGASSTIGTFTVTGTGFSAASVITFNGTPLTTTFPAGTAGTQLTASNVAVPATAGSYSVTVTNPAPGGISNAATFTVTPVLTASPSSLSFTTVAGTASATQTYTLTGAGLPAGGSVQVTLPAGSGFEISTNGTSFGQSASVTYAGIALPATPIYVRLTAANPAGSYSTTLTNTVYDSGNNATTTTALVTATGSVATVYTWIGPANGTWSTATNWSPTRSAPTSGDVLRFTSASSPVITASETIGQLAISNNAAVTIQQSAAITLTINDLVSGPDFSVAAGSTLTLYNTSATKQGLTIQMGSGASALLAGTLVLDAVTTSTASHQLLSGGVVNSIEFVSGSICRATVYFTGDPFGTSGAAANLNNVVFRNGSRYEQYGGSAPFGVGQPSSDTVFEPTSYYVYAVASASSNPSLSGRTYGTFEYATAAANSVSSGVAPTFGGDFIMSNGTLNVNLAGANLKGNLLPNGGTLVFGSGGQTQTVQFNGTAAQTIGGGSGTLTFGAATTVQINNAAGVTLARPIMVPGTLQLTSGKLTTDATNLLTMPASATVSGGLDASFVNGPLARSTSPGASTVVFPVGKGTAYRPITLNTTAQDNATTYRAEQFEGDPGQNGTNPAANDGTTLTRVSKVRSFTITPATSPGTYSGTVTLSYGPNDRVTNPATVVIAKRANSAANWVNFGYTSSTANTVTSGVFTSFSDFALASTNPDVSVNPLPVSLTSFTAARNGSSVALTWTTASEQNSARFEVERSLDGLSFANVATVAAHGTSLVPLNYATLDRNAPTAALYYRLRLVDADGSSAYSAVVVVAGNAGEVALTPNPAHDQVRLVTDVPTAYVLRSALGQVVLSGTTQAGATTVELRGLAAGVYFVELHTSAGRVVRKLVKE